MTTIAHISDLHFGRIDQDVVDRLCHEIESQNPDFVVISGDLTQSSKPSEFEEARAFIDRLPAEVVAVPGNHDLPGWNVAKRFHRPFARYKRYISEDLDPVAKGHQVVIVGLNSARAVVWHHNWSHGRVSRWQMRHVHEHFDAAPPETLKVVTVHHPILPPEDNPGQKLLGRARDAVPAFAKAGVDVVLCGHLHAPYSADTSLHYPQADRSILVVQASTATSTRLRGHANSYNVLRYDSPTLTVQERHWGEGGFEDGPRHVFGHGPRGWATAA